MDNQHAKNAAKSSKDTGKKSATGNSGNFKNDPERASGAGKKGGQHSHSGGKKS